MFSSPGKQAQQAASAVGGMNQQTISQLEGYDTQQRDALRTAIGQTGPNPYFGAAQQLNSDAYRVNGNDMATFGSGAGPGLMPGSSTRSIPPGSMAPPNLIVQGPTSAPPPPPAQPTPPVNPTPVGGSNPFGPRHPIPGRPIPWQPQ